MKTRHTIWTHGISAQVDAAESTKRTHKFGGFTRIVGKKRQGVWVHCAIPTPFVEEGQRFCLESIMFRFHCASQQAYIAQIQVFDGEERFYKQDDLQISQRWDTLLHRVTMPPDRVVLWGICVSIYFVFNGQNDNENTIALAAVGGDFIATNDQLRLNPLSV